MKYENLKLCEGEIKLFPYTDPTGSNFLENENALEKYRAILAARYLASAKIPNSAFTQLEAFSDLTSGTTPDVTTIPWAAFPKTATASDEEIDADRFRWQDEYVEWKAEKPDSSQVTRITFTTEFPEYYQALAEVSLDALIAGIKEVMPDANPTVQELLGLDAEPPFGRAERFKNNLQQNPWNNGEKGILCLAQQFNTLGALFNLVDKCAVAMPNASPGDVCGMVGGACGPQRNSDPVVCLASQKQARSSRGISLPDPVGIRIVELGGIWKINGQRIEINDPAENQGTWVVSRGGRRGVLTVVPGLTLEGREITSGTQVSTQLTVAADVITAPEDTLPDWAKTGQETRI